MLSIFQGKPKNFAASAFGFQPFMSIFEIRHIYIFLNSAFWADNGYLIGIVHIDFFHFISLSSIGVVRIIDINLALDIQIKDTLETSTASFFIFAWETLFFQGHFGNDLINYLRNIIFRAL